LASDSRIPKPPSHARLWAQLSPAARAKLEREGVEAGETIPPKPPPPDVFGLHVRSASERPLPPPTVNREQRRAVGRLERVHALSEHERYQRQLVRDGERLERLRKHIEDRGGDCSGGGLPRLIPKDTFVASRLRMGDLSGFAIRAAFRRCRNKVAIGAIRNAALVPDEHGRARYTWADERARAVATLGLALLELSIPTARVGTWGAIVRGIPRGALCALLSTPWEPDKPKSVSALVGTHRPDGSLQNGNIGYLRALIEAGFCYRQQLPAADVKRFEKCWPSGYPSNRYWIVGDTPTSPLSDETKRRLLALHAFGREAHRERLQRARKAPRQLAGADIAARAAAAAGAPAAPDTPPPD
jgi:hypothetical protein